MTPSTASSRESTLVSGEFPLTDADFRRISAILHEDSGIRLREGRAALVYSRLAKRLRALGVASFKDYCELIGGAEGADERKAMLRALTTNVTRFFREPHHFDHLRALFAGGLAARARAGDRVRIWSAACSTGEEPYSIAMTVLAALPDAGDLDVRILATDIDANVISTAEQAVYPSEAADQSPSWAQAHFTANKAGDRRRVSQAARDLVRFNELNLVAPWPMKGKFDAIFCRNVAIYFDDATQEQLWSRFGQCLSPQGRLYIGHSERIADARFETDGLTIYRLRGRQP